MNIFIKKKFFPSIELLLNKEKKKNYDIFAKIKIHRISLRCNKILPLVTFSINIIFNFELLT